MAGQSGIQLAEKMRISPEATEAIGVAVCRYE